MKKNKKYRKDDSINQLVSKYKLWYFLGFMGMFLLLSVILGVTAYATISQNYLTTTKTIMTDFIENLEKVPQSGPATIVNIRPTDPRMVVSYYYYDSSNENLYYQIIGIDTEEELNTYKAYKSDASTISKIEKFEIITINNYTNLCYTKRLESRNGTYITINNQPIIYVKVYMNIEGETNSRFQFMKTYIICALLMLLLSSVAGIIMSKEGMKPLKNFVKKQVDFVNDASHELRTPLAVVQSKIENILANPDKNVYEVSEALAIALNEINRLNKLTSELLTLARNDKDNISLNIELIELDKELKEIVEPFIEISLIQDRKLTYKGEECYAKLDKDKLKQIMIIIIDNAIKYTNEGDNIDIRLSSTGNDVNIEISDTGIGINDNTKNHIFERFYREDKARSRETGGNGLGLAIANTLVHLQKGRITVDHNHPKGTKFNVYFPKEKNKK